MALAPCDLSNAILLDLRNQYHPEETRTAVIKRYDAAAVRMAIVIKEAESHLFDGADIRHALRSRRLSDST